MYFEKLYKKLDKIKYKRPTLGTKHNSGRPPAHRQADMSDSSQKSALVPRRQGNINNMEFAHDILRTFSSPFGTGSSNFKSVPKGLKASKA